MTIDLDGLDPDGDGISEGDNCPLLFNPAPQCDTNGNGLGNRCDFDFDDDALIDLADFAALYSHRHDAPYDQLYDLNCDGAVEDTDLLLFRPGCEQELVVPAAQIVHSTAADACRAEVDAITLSEPSMEEVLLGLAAVLAVLFIWELAKGIGGLLK